MYQYNPMLLTELKLRKAIDAGRLSQQSVKRLRDAGMIPSLERMNDGVYRGAENMFKKHGVRVFKNKLTPEKSFALYGKGAAESGYLDNSPITKRLMKHVNVAFIPEKGGGQFEKTMMGKLKLTPSQASVIAWHEAREVARTKGSLAAEKDILNQLENIVAKDSRKLSWLKNPIKKLKASISNSLTVNSVQTAATGKHNLGVLPDEGKLMNSYFRRYGIKPGIMTSTDGMGKVYRQGMEAKRSAMNVKQELQARKKSYQDMMIKMM